MADRNALIASILKASGPKPVKVDVEGIGPIYVRVLTAYDADLARKAMDKAKKEDGCDMGRLLTTLLSDADGTSLFDMNDADTVLKLSKLPQKAQSAILKAGNLANAPEEGKA